MDVLHVAAIVLRDLLIAIGVLTVAMIGVLVAALRVPSAHPLRRVLIALCVRMAATIGAGLLAIPIEPIPGLDVAYDIAAPLGLIVFWVTFVRRAWAILRPSTRRMHPPS